MKFRQYDRNYVRFYCNRRDLVHKVKHCVTKIDAELIAHKQKHGQDTIRPLELLGASLTK